MSTGYYDLASKVNTGVYFGSGSSYKTSGNVFSNNTVRTASNINIDRMARDMASGYKKDIGDIEKYLSFGDKAQALEMYEDLFNEVKKSANDYNYELSDGQITSILDEAYMNTTGQSFSDKAIEGTKSPFVTGLLEGVPIFGCFANSYSNKEAMSKVSKEPLRGVDRNMETIGSCVSGALSGALSGGLAGIVIGARAGAAFGNIPGILTGAAVGAVLGIGFGLLNNFVKGWVDENPKAYS